MNRKERKAERREMMLGLKEVFLAIDGATDISEADIRPAGQLDRLNLDSLCRTEATFAIEKRFGVCIDFEQFSKIKTFGGLARHIQHLQRKKSLARV